MNFLAINTAGSKIEVLLVYKEKKSYFCDDKVKASEELIPAIDRLLDEQKLELSDFDFFGCVVGPGSFTGIRIGINTIRAFAYSLNKKTVGVTHNRMLAYNYERGKCATVVDGGNGTCYLGTNMDEEIICLRVEDAVEKLKGFDGIIIADDVTRLYFPSAREIIFDGNALYSSIVSEVEKNGLTDYDMLEPLYIRRSQPERQGAIC